MPQDGEMVFYATREPEDTRAMLAAVLDACAPAGTFRTYRFPAPDRHWEEFQREIGATAVPTSLQESAPPNSLEMVSDSADTNSAIAAWDARYVLAMDDIPSELVMRVRQAVREGITDDIRGQFEPTNLEILIGRHDLFEMTEHEQGFLFAQPFLSVKFYGYGVPEDWEKTRQKIFTLSGVVGVQRLLESHIGPLQQCVYWNG